ncbi:hypothetical protein, partial [Mesorhizobium sp.]
MKFELRKSLTNSSPERVAVCFWLAQQVRGYASGLSHEMCGIAPPAAATAFRYSFLSTSARSAETSCSN